MKVLAVSDFSEDLTDAKDFQKLYPPLFGEQLNLKPLEKSLDEIQFINAQYREGQITFLPALDASLDSISQALAGMNWAHFATHGYFRKVTPSAESDNGGWSNQLF